MTLNVNSLLIGIMAGVASALLLITPSQPSAISVILYTIAALPIFISGLGWSNQSSGTAALTAFIIMTLTSGIDAALVTAATTLLPAAWLTHLSTLARPAIELNGPEDQLIWYPLPQLVLHGIIIMILATIAVGWMINYTPELVSQIVDPFIIAINQSGQANIMLRDPETSKLMLITLIPIMYSAISVITLLAVWYLAIYITRLSGRCKRPKDNLHLTLRMPVPALWGLGLGLIMMILFKGPISYTGAAITGGFSVGFMIAGLAVFHQKMIGKPLRYIALWGAYIAILFFSLPVIIFIIIGLLETGKTTPLLMSKYDNDI